TIDLPAQIELQRDLRVAQRARRGHLGEARDLAELRLERRCHGRRHGLRIGAGQLCRDLERWIVHARQRRDRQQRIGREAPQQQAAQQQRGRDRARDKGWGDVHGIGVRCASCAAASSAALPWRMVTWMPGCSLYWPSTTTCSPAERPESMSACPPLTWATLTGRTATVLSALIT